MLACAAAAEGIAAVAWVLANGRQGAMGIRHLHRAQQF